MESATCCGMESRCKPCMESSRNDAWNQSEGAYTLRVMPCRAKGTDSMPRAGARTAKFARETDSLIKHLPSLCDVSWASSPCSSRNCIASERGTLPSVACGDRMSSIGGGWLKSKGKSKTKLQLCYSIFFHQYFLISDSARFVLVTVSIKRT